MRIAITGVGAITPAGRGPDAVLSLLRAGGHAFRDDAPYPTVGLGNPLGGFVPSLDWERPAEDLLRRAVADALAESGVPVDGLALVVGTSSGNLSGPWEAWHRGELAGHAASPAGTGRADPALAVARALGLGGRVATISVACASGTAALAVAAGWIEDGAGAVVVAGVDALSLFVHAGFSGLGALSRAIPRPFSPERDGLLLGEGAAALVLEPLDRVFERRGTVLAELAGVGLSCDARHMTAPHRDGRGVSAAMRMALDQARLEAEDIDLVSVHGTGTRYNDAMEAHALDTVFGGRGRHVYGIKGAVGHLLGAAGAVECAVAVRALSTGRWPSPISSVDPELPWVPADPTDRLPRTALVTSSAFGGINACAVFTAEGCSPANVDREVVAGASIEVALAPGESLARAWPEAPGRICRLSRYSQVGVWAIARALAAAPHTGGEVGVVLATRSGCAEADREHHARIIAEGAALASRLAFVATVPSAPASEAAVLYGLRGPQLVFVGEDVALEEAARLVRRGRASCVVALWCEAARPDVPAIARATVLTTR